MLEVTVVEGRLNAGIGCSQFDVSCAIRQPQRAGNSCHLLGRNIAIQILATGDASSLQEVRAIVDRSFPTEVFEPLETDQWQRQTERFEQYCEIIYA